MLLPDEPDQRDRFGLEFVVNVPHARNPISTRRGLFRPSSLWVSIKPALPAFSRSRSPEQSALERVEASAAVALALDRLQPSDVSRNGPGAPR